MECKQQEWHNWEESYTCAAEVCVANTVDELRAIELEGLAVDAFREHQDGSNHRAAIKVSIEIIVRTYALLLMNNSEFKDA